MRIVVEDLPDHPIEMAGEVALQLDHHDHEEIALVAPLRYALRLSRRGTTVDVVGHIEARLEVACSRCAMSLPWQLERDFSAVFAAANEREGRLPRELDADDLDLDYYEGEAIDGLRMLSEQVFLGLPMKILCTADCRGLCASCGANLNETECDCKPDPDPRWSALADLRDRL